MSFDVLTVIRDVVVANPTPEILVSFHLSLSFDTIVSLILMP